MEPGTFRFEEFTLDAADRQLRRNGTPVELNGRYFDALALLVRESGRLVSKDRFMDEVWRGIPVTDEALTQCVRTLRRQLGDDASRPRFIETVPKHGYRFIAPVDTAPDGEQKRRSPVPSLWRELAALAAAGAAGGAAAGLLGGLFYGFAAAAEPLGRGAGGTSVLLVLLAITFVVGLVGAAGVSVGIAAAGLAVPRFGGWSILGGAVGGLIVGAVVELLGLDAFHLLLGRSPGDITGAFEGALLGAAVGFGLWLATLANRPPSIRRGAVSAGLAGAAAGMLVPLSGGRMMGGSLELLAGTFPGSRISLDKLGALFGEVGFGPLSEMVTGALEGGLFGAGVAGAMLFVKRKYGPGL